MKQKKAFFFIVWFLILISGPVSVLKITPIARLTFENLSLLISFLLRITGLIAFSMIFVQIILGAFMNKWIERFGGWVFKFHVTEGAIAYSLILAHPILFLLYSFRLKGVLDPFYVFTGFCLMCPKPIELYYTFGRIAFWFITIAIMAAVIRNEPWWRNNWRKFHILNYFAFFLIAIHSWFAGTDMKIPPFVWVFWIAIASVAFSIFYKWVYLKTLKSPKT